MDISVFLARFLGAYMLIMFAIWVLRRQALEGGIRNIMGCGGTFALTALIQVIIGLLIILSHSVWKLNWQGLITLFGYFAVIQGIVRLSFPEEIKAYILKSVEKGAWMWMVFLGLFGSLLAYHGFIA